MCLIALAPPSSFPYLQVILPIGLVLALGIATIIAGFFYRRRQRSKKSGIKK